MFASVNYRGTPARELFPGSTILRHTDSPSSMHRSTNHHLPTSSSGNVGFGTPTRISSVGVAARPHTPTTAISKPTLTTTSPTKRVPLGDASFLTQVQQGSVAPPKSLAVAPTISRVSAPAVRSPVPHKAHLTPTNCAMSLLPSHPLEKQRPLLVLDLDETLVHASVETSDGRHDAQFVVEMGGQKINVFIKVRPFAEDFLRYVSTMFEVCVFTASLAPYADKVVDYLDPTGTRVHHRLYREHCTNVDGTYVKDLNLMGRRIERVAIVDNSPVAYSFHPENAIPINSWFHCKKDTELAQLMPLLQDFARSGDFFATRSRFETRGCFPLCT